MGIIQLLGGLFGLVVLGVLGVLARDVIARLSGSSLIYLFGLFCLFIGERVFGDGGWRWPVTGLGLVVIAASLGLRAYALGKSEGARRGAHQAALISGIVAVGGLLIYAAASPTAMTTFGLLDPAADDNSAADRWYGTLHALWPIIVLTASLPMLSLDRVLAAHPVVLPAGAIRRTVTAAVTAGMAVALVFPANYLANAHNMTYDAAYFRTTRPGTSTMALARSLTTPAEAIAFFPPGSEVKEQLVPYFNELAAASDGRFTVTIVDQPLAPKLAEELKVRENGWIAIRMGDSVEKHRLGDDMTKAKRELKKLDTTVNKLLLQVSRGQKVAYMVVGHGEANYRERDNQLKKLSTFKKLLEAQNYKVSNLGVAEGLAVAVPDDADVVLLLGPEKPLAPEETESIKAYLAQGGSLLVAVEPSPEGDSLDDLMAHLGVTVGRAPLAHATQYLNQNRGIADRVLLATNRFGSHPAVKTLSKAGTQMALVLPTVVSVQKAEGGSFKTQTLVRTLDQTFEDTNGDRQPSPGEASKVHEVALAVTPDGTDGFKAVVLGDAALFSDPVLQFSQGNLVFILDAMRWLAGDDDIAGELQSEEDVKIIHTRDDDMALFYLTIFGMPMLVLGAGIIVVSLRRRAS